MKLIYLLLILSVPIFGESYVDDFTRLSVDPMIEGLGGSFVANGEAFSASNYNPALLSLTTNQEINASHSNCFDGLYTVSFVSFAKRHNNRISYGLSAIIAGGDGVPVTALRNGNDTLSSNNRPYLVEEKSHYDVIFNPSASYQFDNKLSIGVAMRIFYRHLIDESAYGAGLSAGLYKEFNSKTSAGLYIRNLSTMPVMWSTGTNEIALPSARLGLKRDVLRSTNIDLSLTGDLEYMISEKRIIGGGGIAADIYERFSLMVGYSDIGFSTGASAIFNSIGVSASYSNERKLEDSFKVALFYRWE